MGCGSSKQDGVTPALDAGPSTSSEAPPEQEAEKARLKAEEEAAAAAKAKAEEEARLKAEEEVAAAAKARAEDEDRLRLNDEGAMLHRNTRLLRLGFRDLLLHSQSRKQACRLDARADQLWKHRTTKRAFCQWHHLLRIAAEEAATAESAVARARLVEGYTELKLTPKETMNRIQEIWDQIKAPPIPTIQPSPLAGLTDTSVALRALRVLRVEREKERGVALQAPVPTQHALLVAARQALADEYLALPKEEQDFRKFRKFDKFHLPDHGSLNAALANGSTALLRGDYLERLAKQGGRLGHRAELPAEAFYEGPIWLERTFSVDACVDGRDGTPCVYEGVLIVSVTYAWQTQDHPDPNGEQLRDVAEFLRWLRRAKNHVYYGGKGKLVVVFWDWASLYQGARTAEQTAMFNSALENVNIWYCHPLTLTLMNRKAIAGQERSYDERGWPAFERTVSEFVKGECGVMDLQSLLNTLADEGDSVRSKGFYLMASRFQSKLPLSPDAMSAKLASSYFTRAADINFVQGYYRKTFEVVLGRSTELYFGCMHWIGKEQWVAFCTDVLPLCVRLETLHLDGNPNLEVGIVQLVEKLPTTLRYLNLENTGCFGDGSMADWGRLPALKTVCLSGTGVTDSISAARTKR